MFEVISVRRQNSVGPQPIDLGFICETMLFYGRVRLIADYGMIQALAKACGPEDFVGAVRSGQLEVAFLENGLGVRTDRLTSGVELHQPTTYKILGVSEMQDALPRIFRDLTGKSGRGRRLAAALAPHLNKLEFRNDVLDMARADYAEADFMAVSVVEILRHAAPSYQPPAHPYFEVLAVGDKLRVDSNIDFAAATESHKSLLGSEAGPLTPAYVLSAILNADGDLHLAGEYSSELATDPLGEALIAKKCRELVVGRMKRAADIELFQELVLEQAGAIREAVNSGSRTFADVLRLLESADRFREWLQTQQPSVEVVDAYYRDATADTWAAKLPVKVLRWAIAAGLGVAVGGLGVEGAAVTAGLAAADMFLVERIAAGWRPNQFVEGRLKPFVGEP
jgi:hypothetical protein